MEIKWLQQALENLESHANFIAREDPAAAQKTVERIHDAVSLLSGNPAMGYPGRIDGTRELVVTGTRFIIPYRVLPRLKRVEILRVFHSSREPPKAW